jgi:Ser/Thr protein kinase RdoA (MazF antagonist)
MRLMRGLAASAPGLPVPAVLDGDPVADPPFLVSAFVPGRNGGELLGSDEDARVLGRVAGEAARAVAAAPARLVGVSPRGPWSDPARLRLAGERWLGSATLPERDPSAPGLSTEALAAARRVLAAVPALFVGRRGEPLDAILAHGDLAPVNLVVDGDRLAGILDLERLRLAPVAFDAAWVRLLVRHHHPEAWGQAGPGLLDAARLGDAPELLGRLDGIALLACLEAASTLPRRSPARAAWLARAGEIVRRELPGP